MLIYLFIEQHNRNRWHVKIVRVQSRVLHNSEWIFGRQFLHWNFISRRCRNNRPAITKRPYVPERERKKVRIPVFRQRGPLRSRITTKMKEPLKRTGRKRDPKKDREPCKKHGHRDIVACARKDPPSARRYSKSYLRSNMDSAIPRALPSSD